MSINLTDPIYQDADKAREHLEALQWPNGPVCPHCGNVDPERITKLEGKSTRPGVYKCNECRKPFSVTVGTVFERSHIPLNKWLLAVHLMTSSKKGISAAQLQRNLGLGSYRTAWFMAHRIREAMQDDGSEPLGGKGKTVEADETYIGKKSGQKKRAGGAHKMKVVALVERGGRSRDAGLPFERQPIVGVCDGLAQMVTDIVDTFRREFAGRDKPPPSPPTVDDPPVQS